jgi:hypothetical protein
LKGAINARRGTQQARYLSHFVLGNTC